MRWDCLMDVWYLGRTRGSPKPGDIMQTAKTAEATGNYLPIDIKSDGPLRTRETVTFKNWKGEHGLLIRKEKLEQDAKNFRRIGQLLAAAAGQNEEYNTLASWMMTLADQFQNASCGYDPTAEAARYDDDTEEVEEDVEEVSDDGQKKTVKKTVKRKKGR